MYLLARSGHGDAIVNPVKQITRRKVTPLIKSSMVLKTVTNNCKKMPYSRLRYISQDKN